MVEAPLSTKTRVAIAARKGYLDRALTVVTSKDVGDYIPIPDYYDGQIKLSHDLGPNETLEVLGLTSHDTLTRTLKSGDPAQDKSDYTLTAFSRVGLSYKKQLADGSNVLLTPWVGVDHLKTQDSFGGAPSEVDTKSKVFGFRSAWRGRMGAHVVGTVGLDVEGSFSDLTRRGSVTLPAREGDYAVFGQAPSGQVNGDSWQTTIFSIAPYVQADIGLLGDRVHIVPGLRVEPYVTSTNHRLPSVPDVPDLASPSRPQRSIRVSRSVTKWCSGWASRPQAGYYHQSPQATDLSAVFGNPQLDIEHGYHVLGGATFKLTEHLSLEEVVFYSKSAGLVTRSNSSTPLLAEALVQEGQGRAYGTQLLLRQELAAGFFGWVSYTLMRSERKDHEGNDWRLFDFDQTHVATVVGSYDLGKGFELGARFRYATGLPRTPVVGTFYSARRDLYEPQFGQQNSLRIRPSCRPTCASPNASKVGVGRARYISTFRTSLTAIIRKK